MKQTYIAVIVMLLASLTSGCDYIGNVKALNKKIVVLSGKLAEAENTVDNLQDENENLKEQLSKSIEKDKNNLNRLFR